ncbi:MAG: HlyD family efflux transporter periplasmic adaptor subunit [Moorea sp. SIO2B7]|nr:HlyD family efflux transporter periplasmic adaptor subunit [Moorena sp. SIO2B7]
MVKLTIPISRKLLGAALVLSFVTTACEDQNQQAAAPPPIPVKLQTLETATLVNSSNYVGTLEAQERVSLAPRINGRILDIYVKQGDIVAKGNLIVKLEPTQQQEEVNAAVAEVNAQKAQLNVTQAELRAAQAEESRAETEVERAKSELARAEADVEDAKAEVVLAKADYERWKFLVKEEVQPKQELDQKTRDYETKKARLEAREKARDASQESVNASIKSLQIAQRQIEQARANVDRQNAEISRAKGDLGAINQNLAFNLVRAPITGIVGDFQTLKVGDFVNVGQEITTITHNNVLTLNINIPVEYLSKLKIGTPAQIINADGTPGIEGRISYISPTVDQEAQAILTKFTFNNDGSLRDNQYVTVRVIWAKKPGVLVPTTAVII